MRTVISAGMDAERQFALSTGLSIKEVELLFEVMASLDLDEQPNYVDIECPSVQSLVKSKIIEISEHGFKVDQAIRYTATLADGAWNRLCDASPTNRSYTSRQQEG